MGSLAQAWRCDASNATWIVNRLEAMGLAERCNVPGDRRIKLVLLTEKGAAVRAELFEEFHQPPAELLAFDLTSLQSLAALLAQISGDIPSEAQPTSVRAAGGKAAGVRRQAASKSSHRRPP